MKISCLDIETAPNLVYTYELRNTTIPVGNIVVPSDILGFAAKWLDDCHPAKFFSPMGHIEGYHRMLTELARWIDESDAIIHYNGNRFDRKKINWEFAKMGFTPPAPAANIDLWAAVVKNFDPASSKLAFVAPELIGAEKDNSGGMKTFIGCVNGDPQAWEDLERYCIQDVELLPPLYHKLLPWISAHPNQGLYSGGFKCPFCDHERVQKRGFHHTQTRVYQRYWCVNCGGWSKAPRSIESAELKGLPA